MLQFYQIHITMKLSIFSFLVLSILGGTCVMAGLPYCGHGKIFPSNPHRCLCDVGYAGADPTKNCLGAAYDKDNEKCALIVLISPDPCDSPCDWEYLGDAYANYSCAPQDDGICDYSFCP